MLRHRAFPRPWWLCLLLNSLHMLIREDSDEYIEVVTLNRVCVWVLCVYIMSVCIYVLYN